MSVTLYTGSPGSGKSLHCTEVIIKALQKGINVISNYSIAIERVEGVRGKYVNKSDDTITVKFLIEFAKEFHEKGKEGQTIVVIDEAQLKFNSRAWQSKDRTDWNKFFTVHRHLGYEVILATQKDSFLDSQIRGLIEYELNHKNLKKSKLGDIFPFMPNWFICIKTWYHSKMKINVNYFFMKQYVIDSYDSYVMFDKIINEMGEK